jgi:hypothetical protein
VHTSQKNSTCFGKLHRVTSISVRQTYLNHFANWKQFLPRFNINVSVPDPIDPGLSRRSDVFFIFYCDSMLHPSRSANGLRWHHSIHVRSHSVLQPNTISSLNFLSIWFCESRLFNLAHQHSFWALILTINTSEIFSSRNEKIREITAAIEAICWWPMRNLNDFETKS